MYQEETLKYKTGDSLINSLIHVLEHPHNTQSSNFCNHGNHDLIIYSFFWSSVHTQNHTDMRFRTSSIPILIQIMHQIDLKKK